MSAATLDSLYSRVARKVLVESLLVKKGDNVTVETWNNGLPFARHVMIQARKLGAVPVAVFEDEAAYVEGVKRGSKSSLGVMGKQERALLSNTDAFVFIPGPPIGVYYKRLSAEERADSTRYNQSWYKAAKKAKLRGVRLAYGYLGRDASRALDVPIEEIILRHMKAALTDYKALGKRAREVAAILKDGRRAELTTPGFRLMFKLKGELNIDDGIVDDQDVADGNNMTAIPPGFVYKEVDPNSARGKFRISPSRGTLGEVKDGVLEFEGGELVSWHSEGSQGVLDSMFKGANSKQRRFSAVYVGLNPNLRFGLGNNSCPAGTLLGVSAGRGHPTTQGTLVVSGKTLVADGKLR